MSAGEYYELLRRIEALEERLAKTERRLDHLEAEAAQLRQLLDAEPKKAARRA